jgi:hypothetical protein
MGAGDLKHNPAAISDNDQVPKGSAANLTTAMSGKGASGLIGKALLSRMDE